MRSALHLLLLRVFGRLPVRLRRAVVATLSPSFTVGANCVIERSDGSLLLVRQVYRSRWGLPGGLLERDETPVDAVHREVAEEVGLTIEVLGEPAVVVDGPARRVDVVFRARPVGAVPDVPTPASPEILEARWHRPEQLPELQPEAAEAIITLARSATGDLGARLRPLPERTGTGAPARHGGPPGGAR